MTKGLVINFVVIFAFACPIFAGTGATHEVDQAVRILREHVQKQPALSIESLIQAPKWQKLFPKQIRILRFSDPVFRKSLDLAIRSIFLSEEGRDICSVALGVPQNLEDFFGLTPEAARALASRCGIPGVWPRREYMGPARVFYLLVHEDENFPLDSWTSQNNETFLFFETKQLTGTGLIQRLIHEYGVHLDFQVISSDLWYENNFTNLASLQGDTCLFLKALQHPLIRSSFLMYRAFRLEDSILKTATLQSFGSTCEARAGSFIQRSVALANYSFLNLAFAKYNDPHLVKSRQCSDQRPLTLAEALLALSKMRVILRSQKGPSFSICEFMSVPTLGFGSEYMPRNGPRPRLNGNGWENNRYSLEIDEMPCLNKWQRYAQPPELAGLLKGERPSAEVLLHLEYLESALASPY